MRPIHGALKSFESPRVRPRLLFPKFLMGFCSDRSYECAYTFEVRSFTRVPEITRGITQKIWAVPGYAHAPFFYNAFFRMDPVNVPAKFEVRIALPVPEIIAIEVVFWEGEERIPNLGEEEAVGGSALVPFGRALVSCYIKSPP